MTHPDPHTPCTSSASPRPTNEPTIQNATANPTSVYDMVKGWYKNEQGEKVKIPGALGAENIYTESLAAISANMGDIKAGSISSTPEAGETKPNVLLDLDNEEFRIGNSPSLEDSGSEDAEYIHYTKGQGLVMKIKNFVVTAIASIISGIFRVKAKGTADSDSFFVVNPESTTDSTTGTPAKTVKINGGQVFPYNYGVIYHYIPDMQGLPRHILISDITTFWTSPETTINLPKQGFCGFLTFCRNSGYTVDGGGFVDCVVSYQNKNTSTDKSVVQLRYNPNSVSNYQTGKPCVVKYNDRYYLSLYHADSNTFFQLSGAMYNLLPEFQTVLESDLEVIQEGTIETITDSLTVTGRYPKGTLPVGTVYVQYPDQSEPASIFGGTWSNISSQYAGRFFRAEGGNAVAFGSGQAEGLPVPYHDHSFSLSGRYGMNGASITSPYWGSGDRVRGSGTLTTPGWGNFGNGATNIYGKSTHVTPENMTIRIWKRIN